MKKLVYLNLAFFLAIGLGLATPGAEKGAGFVGTISDKMCGAKHMMPGKSAKECTLECGAPFVLVTVKGKIYELSDKETPKQFAGQKVKVSGKLEGDKIDVTSIEAAK